MADERYATEKYNARAPNFEYFGISWCASVIYEFLNGNYCNVFAIMTCHKPKLKVLIF